MNNIKAFPKNFKRHALWIVSWCLLFFSTWVQSQPLVGSSDRLATLQKIQGAWRGECEAAQSDNKNAYKKVDILVSYTHFDFEVIEYEGMDCTKERARFSQRYVFALGPGFVTKTGKTAYSIDFKKADSKPLLHSIHMQDLIYYKSGAIYFGRSYALGEGQRPSAINFQNKYVR